MEEIFKGEHIIVGLVLILALHLIRDLYKNNKKDTDDEFKDLRKSLDHLETKLESFSNILSSYMHTTISLNEKMQTFDKKMEDLMQFQTEMKTISRIRGDKI